MNSPPPTFVAGPPKLPRRPDVTVVRDLPVSTWTQWSVPDVRDALEAHTLGAFSRSGQLADACMGDDRVSSVLQTRVLGMLGLPFQVRPSETAHAQRARRVARELEAVWWDICPEHQVAELLRNAIMMGFAIAEIVWTSRRGRWYPTLRTWHPQLTYYRLDLRQYLVFTQDGQVEVTPGDGKWIVLAPHGLYRGWMGGAIRAVAILWLLRQYAHRDWARYSEVHGMPLRGCRVPASASEPDKENFYRQIANLGVETTIQLPQGMDGQGFGVDLIEAAAGNWDAFERLIQKCDVGIACQMLGQNLSTEVQGGSYAAASVHGRVRQDYLEADVGSMATTLHSQLVRPWCKFNFGNEDLSPWPEWDPTPPEDRGQNATTLQAFSEALSKLLSLGVPVDVRALAEKFAIPLRAVEVPQPIGPLDANTYAYGVVTTNEARARLQLPPMDGGDKPPSPLMPPAATLLSRRPSREGAINGQRYADAVTRNAVRHAARSLRPDVASVLRAIDEATSFDAVKQHLARAYRAMSPAALGEMTANSLAMAHLAGRSSMAEDA